MTDRLFLSMWLRHAGKANGPSLAFDTDTLLRNFAKMLGQFPFSMLAARGPAVRVQAIDRGEPALLERELPTTGERVEAVVEIIESANEFMQQDCMCEVDASWDLWQFHGDWKLAPSGVTLVCFGPDFDNEVGDHLRIEFGPDSHFLPDPDIEGSVRMGESNLKSLVHLVSELERSLNLERRRLWSESGENPVELLMQALEKSAPE
jgi:hypothetical protein